MNVALWAEIRRLAEIEKLSARAIARRLHCSCRTVAKAWSGSSLPHAQPSTAPAPGPVQGQDRRPAGPVPDSRRCASTRNWPAAPRATPAA